MPSRIEISNLAVAKLPAAPIQDIGENSLEARECRRFYPQVLSAMLEGPHDFSFANRRVALAQTTNDRDQEWLYAYVVPSDMASPIRVIPDFEGLGLGLPIPLPGEPYSEVWASAMSTFEAAYIVENGILYTNIENASLEYSVNDVEEANLSHLVVEAMACELAFHLALPVKKDAKLRSSLFDEKELAWSRAIADDQNRHPRHAGDFISEAMAARSGGYFTGTGPA